MRSVIQLAPALLVALAACSNSADSTPDASPIRRDGAFADTSTEPTVDAGPLRTLVLNEVAAAENPDWIEIVNATTAPVQLSEFVFVDVANDFAKAVPFPPMLLGPGARYVQELDGTIVPFKLAGDEEVWIYRASDHALSDGVDWAEGQSPAGGSYARIPDVFGPFQTVATSSRGMSNQ